MLNSAVVISAGSRRRYLSVAEAEAEFGISRWTWRRMAYDGRIASSKVGTRLLIPVGECDRVIREGARPRLAEAVKRLPA
ncbi:hypothetical protein ACPOL_0251 [Acidisarcina polymorpha]|uniref:Helix-turn-helix domain-containing protein n=1 Tax=Acidisarcina polymorpha TaxID=2211140 RepID=A0A2Z5FT23_9BACT|nr:helix-turn-helix domain-containing protein [Acidisarcina polymorpha]AXC09636.1 hypothetical protein ACPOL_0251 [Acidisarcina polymorpha]